NHILHRWSTGRTAVSACQRSHHTCHTQFLLRHRLVVLGPHPRRRGPGDTARVTAERDVVTVHGRRFRAVVAAAQTPGRRRTPDRGAERRRHRRSRTPATYRVAVTRCRTTIPVIP